MSMLVVSLWFLASLHALALGPPKSEVHLLRDVSARMFQLVSVSFESCTTIIHEVVGSLRRTRKMNKNARKTTPLYILIRKIQLTGYP